MTRVAAIQFKAEKGRAEAGLAALVALVDEAAAAGASLVVCPEMATTGYLFSDGNAARSESVV